MSPLPHASSSAAVYHSLAEQYGTPLYLYHESKMVEQFSDLSKALGDLPHLICFAVKANSNLAILNLFKKMGAGFDVVSEGELRRVITVGGDPRTIAFAGVGKTVEEIEFALAHNIRLINVESAAELRAVAAAAKRLRHKAPVSFRLNPDVKVETHPYLATGLRTSKFGIPIDEALELWEVVKNDEWLDLVGVDCHIGSQLTDVAPLEEAYRSLLQVATAFVEKGAIIRYVDFGGGLGVAYSGKYEPLDVGAYSAMVRRLTAGTNFDYMFEPGKFLIAESGVLLTRVLYLKDNGGHKFAVIDAGMNDLLRPSLYEAYHRIERVPQDGDDPDRGEEVVDVVGPVCETGCYLAKRRPIAVTGEGDLLAVFDAGAYGFSMASNYNSRRLPAEVLLDGRGRSALIRRRESYEELWRNEIVEPEKSR